MLVQTLVFFRIKEMRNAIPSRSAHLISTFILGIFDKLILSSFKCGGGRDREGEKGEEGAAAHHGLGLLVYALGEKAWGCGWVLVATREVT